MRLHAEVPLVALPGLIPLPVALVVLVLGRTGRGDDRGVHDSCPPKALVVAYQVIVDCTRRTYGTSRASPEAGGSRRSSSVQDRTHPPPTRRSGEAWVI